MTQGSHITTPGQYYQQGDVIIRKISKLPEGLTLQGDKVLQHGETTGHMHQFARDAKVAVYVTVPNSVQDQKSLSAAAPTGLNFRTITENGNKYIVVDAPCALSHEEHKPIMIEPGIYEIDIVREFNYDTYEAQRVVD